MRVSSARAAAAANIAPNAQQMILLILILIPFVKDVFMFFR
jgi:hypothetical protein